MYHLLIVWHLIRGGCGHKHAAYWIMVLLLLLSSFPLSFSLCCSPFFAATLAACRVLTGVSHHKSVIMSDTVTCDLLTSAPGHATLIKDLYYPCEQPTSS